MSGLAEVIRGEATSARQLYAKRRDGFGIIIGECARIFCTCQRGLSCNQVSSNLDSPHAKTGRHFTPDWTKDRIELRVAGLSLLALQ